MGVNGRDGTVFDSSYERGAPADFPLTGVVPGFQKAIAGQTVGSTVAVAMASPTVSRWSARAGIQRATRSSSRSRSSTPRAESRGQMPGVGAADGERGDDDAHHDADAGVEYSIDGRPWG